MMDQLMSCLDGVVLKDDQSSTLWCFYIFLLNTIERIWWNWTPSSCAQQVHLLYIYRIMCCFWINRHFQEFSRFDTISKLFIECTRKKKRTIKRSRTAVLDYRGKARYSDSNRREKVDRSDDRTTWIDVEK
jgi:hypothetical protein